MSAPKVRITRAPFDRQPVIWECDECGKNGFVMNDPGDALITHLHEKVCPATKLARLQARWDARDEALRGLIEQWRAEAQNRQTGGLHDRGYAMAMTIAANELERAMEGDRD